LRRTSERKEGNGGAEVRNSLHHHPWVYILVVKFGFRVSGGGLGLERRQREVLEREYQVFYNKFLNRCWDINKKDRVSKNVVAFAKS
jgi:hypothetical protein